jgi:hypothetical protein
MKARFIRKLSLSTMLFSCDPPMVFQRPERVDGPADEPAVEASHLIVTHFDRITPDYPRVVIHAACLLAGESDEKGGIGYGAQGSRVMDGLPDGCAALNASGYDVVWPKEYAPNDFSPAIRFE